MQSLDRHRMRQDKERELLGREWTQNGLIFTSDVGTVLDPDNVSRLFSRLPSRPASAAGTRTSCATAALL